MSLFELENDRMLTPVRIVNPNSSFFASSNKSLSILKGKQKRSDRRMALKFRDWIVVNSWEEDRLNLVRTA